MKKFLSSSVLFAVILLAFGCQNDVDSNNPNTQSTQKSMDYKGMAQDLCQCMSPLMEMQQKIAKLSAEGKTDEIQELLTTVEKLSEDGDKCVAELEEKYGVIEDENEQKANAAFQKACPEIAQMLNNAAEE